MLDKQQLQIPSEIKANLNNLKYINSEEGNLTTLEIDQNFGVSFEVDKLMVFEFFKPQFNVEEVIL